MKKLKNYDKNNSLIRAGLFLFIATLFLNFMSYLYHFYMGRVLGPVDYGILGVILSLLYIVTVPFNVIQTVIAKFTAGYYSKKKEKVAGALLFRGLRFFLAAGAVCLLLFFLLIPFLADFFKIPASVLWIFSPIIILALVLPVLRGYFQGAQNFKGLGWNLIGEGFFKFFFGVVLVYIGFRVYGAVAGILIAYIIVSLIAFFMLRKKMDKGEVKNKNEIFKDTWP